MINLSFTLTRIGSTYLGPINGSNKIDPSFTWIIFNDLKSYHSVQIICIRYEYFMNIITNA